MQKKFSGVFLIVALLAAIYISIKVAVKQNFYLDTIVVKLFAKTPDSLHPFFIFITEFGDKKGIGVVALIILAWLLVRKNFAGVAALALAVALGNELSKLLKGLFARPRPDLEHLVTVKSYSFPSGHAMVGMIVYLFIAYLIMAELSSKAEKIITALLTILLLLLIGASRVILQVHYPSDVIGGYAFGYIWVLIWIHFYHYLKKRLNNE